MIAAFRYEVRRLTSLRSSSRIPVIATVLAAVFGLVAALAASAGANFATFTALRLTAAVPVLIAAVLLGAASSGHEYRYGMRSVTCAVIPGRARGVVAKIVVTAATTALLGLAASTVAAALYSGGIAWAYAGDESLVPARAVPSAITAGLVPAAAAAIAAGFLGLTVGWLARWYRTGVGLAVAFVVLAVPIVAGWIAALPGVSGALAAAENTLRKTPVLDGLLNPHALAAWPNLSRVGGGLHLAALHPAPPNSLATTALMAVVALITLLVGVARWQRN